MEQGSCVNPRVASDLQIERLREHAALLEEENLRLEETLRRNSRVFLDLLTNGDAGIILTAPDRRVVRVIKGITGMDPDSCIGQPIESFVAAEDRQTVVDAYRRLLEGRNSRVKILVRVPRPDGISALYAATGSDMLSNPDIHGIVWNYSAYPLLEAPVEAGAGSVVLGSIF